MVKSIITRALPALLILPLPADIPEEERAALIAFYHALNGDEWKKNTGWKTEPLENDDFGAYGSEGDWFGVTVSGDHVTEISFQWNRLKGKLPPELGNLSHLKKFSLNSEIFVKGSIPGELGDLARLEELSLIYLVQMTGEIPPELGALIHLDRLHISATVITGSIPPELDAPSPTCAVFGRTTTL